jgi:hypothetical protein
MKTTNLEEFERELQGLINRYSIENMSDTPDFILAEYLVECLQNFSTITRKRSNWYSKGEKPKVYVTQGEIIL